MLNHKMVDITYGSGNHCQIPLHGHTFCLGRYTGIVGTVMATLGARRAHSSPLLKEVDDWVS